MALNVQLYSSRPLPRQFQLSGDPYDNDADGEAARTELGAMKIFFYRDEEHPRGVVIGDKLEVPAKAFYAQLIMDEDEMAVDEWEDTPAKQRAKHGDDFAWLLWNIDRVVVEVTETTVRLAN